VRSPRRLPVLRKSLFLSCIALLAAIPIALSACGGDDDEADTTAAATTTTTTEENEATTGGGGGGGAATGGGENVDISEVDFKINPADVTTKAGSVTFDISNDGESPHNLEVEGNGVEQVSDTFQPGDSGELTVDLQPGTYEMYCAIPGHRELGMEGEVTVQ
jgi:uncharacterized cupredoxin-like copper-binding protein